MIFVQPTNRQAARAGNMVYAFLEFRTKIEHESLEPVISRVMFTKYDT